MQQSDSIPSKGLIHGMKLAHHEYFAQFSDIVEKDFSINDEMEGYRTCQSIPCSDDDSLPRMFRKKNGQNPIIPIYSEEELEETDDLSKYKQVTKGALSFNTSPEAAVKSALNEDARIRKEKGGWKKSLKYRKQRGDKVAKFVFPKGTVLVSAISHEHYNILMPDGINIEMFRDTSFESLVNYENYDAE